MHPGGGVRAITEGSIANDSQLLLAMTTWLEGGAGHESYSGLPPSLLPPFLPLGLSSSAGELGSG